MFSEFFSKVRHKRTSRDWTLLVILFNFPFPDKLIYQGSCAANSSVGVSSLSIQT